MGPGILTLDPSTHVRVDACAGPLPDGSCPKVAVGAVVPCAGMEVVPAGAADAQPYCVSSHMTLCPRTLAEALAVPSDSALLVA
ncbi:MAG TPA: hypothetical protein VEK76_07270 [Candidatus Binatia bacterium]|nr:hypothetical protein [Candidatus Binatia bacterium]